MLSPSMIHLQVDILKLNSMVIRPGLVRTTRTTTLLTRRFSSTPEPEPSTPSSPTDGYKLPSGDTIPSVGLGTWRASEEDVRKAVKVLIPEESIDQGEPKQSYPGRVECGVSPHRLRLGIWGASRPYSVVIPRGNLTVVCRTKRQLGTQSTRAVCDDKIFG